MRQLCLKHSWSREQCIESAVVGPGATWVVGDKGYSSGKIRRYLRRRGIRYSIPRKGNKSTEENLTRRFTASVTG